MYKVLLWVLVAWTAGSATAQAQQCASRLFVSGFFSTVHVFDACTGAYLRDLDSKTRIRGPQAVRLGPNGNIYVVSEQSQQILEYRNDTLEFVGVFAAFSGLDPTGVAFAPSGDVFVAAFKTDEVRRLSATGVPIDTPIPTHTPGVNGPDNGMTFGPDGNLYIPGFESSTVARYDPRTGYHQHDRGERRDGPLRNPRHPSGPLGQRVSSLPERARGNCSTTISARARWWFLGQC